LNWLLALRRSDWGTHPLQLMLMGKLLALMNLVKSLDFFFFAK